MKYSDKLHIRDKASSERPVAVIFGGEGCERDISRMSAESIILCLRKMNVPHLPIFIDGQGFWFCVRGDIGASPNDPHAYEPAYPVRLHSREGGISGFLTASGIEEVRGAIPALHGELGEDGVIQGALRTAGIAYVGSDTTAGALLMDKAYAKLLAEYMDIPTVPWFLFVSGDVPFCRGSKVAEGYQEAATMAEALGYPLFVKPARAGSSFGIGRADSEEELISAIEQAMLVGEPRVIVEKCLEKPRELECAYFEGESRIFTSPGEIESGGFYSFDKKYLDTSSVEITERADIPDGIREKITEYSARLCLISGVRDIARIDYFLLGDSLYFNEINTFPGMTDTSLYPKMLCECGIDLEKLLRTLLTRLDERA